MTLPLLSRLKVYWAAIRPSESLMMLGVPGLGILFARPSINPNLLGRCGLLLFCGLLIASHIYVLNDLFGLTYDLQDRHKSDRPLLARQLKPRQMWLFCAALGLAGYALLLLIAPGVFGLAFSLTALWMLYSLPWGLKGYPIVTSAVNGLGAGIIPFLIGQVFVGGWSGAGLLASLYFGLIACAGQMNREILDLEADAASALTTTAVWLGREPTFRLSFLLFALAGLYLLALSLFTGVPAWPLGLAAVGVQPLHWLAYRRCLRQGLESRAALVDYIRSYRNLYAGLGLLFGILLLSTELIP